LFIEVPPVERVQEKLIAYNNDEKSLLAMVDNECSGFSIQYIGETKLRNLVVFCFFVEGILGVYIS
jgi:hypothetical protein